MLCVGSVRLPEPIAACLATPWAKAPRGKPREVCVHCWRFSYQHINTFKITSWKSTFMSEISPPSLLAFVLQFKVEDRQCACACVSVGKTNTLTSSTVSGMHMRYSFINMVPLQREVSFWAGLTVLEFVYLSCLGCIADTLRQATDHRDYGDVISDALLLCFADVSSPWSSVRSSLLMNVRCFLTSPLSLQLAVLLLFSMNVLEPAFKLPSVPPFLLTSSFSSPALKPPTLVS